MAELIQKTDKMSFDVNVLTKKEDGMYVAHCLELDIVAVGETIEAANQEIIELIVAQIDYAFSNDNLENLYHPAPRDVWDEFLKCRERTERRYPIISTFHKKSEIKSLVPAWLIAKTCEPNNFCHA